MFDWALNAHFLLKIFSIRVKDMNHSQQNTTVLETFYGKKAKVFQDSLLSSFEEWRLMFFLLNSFITNPFQKSGY